VSLRFAFGEEFIFKMVKPSMEQLGSDEDCQFLYRNLNSMEKIFIIKTKINSS